MHCSGSQRYRKRDEQALDIRRLLCRHAPLDAVRRGITIAGPANALRSLRRICRTPQENKT
jgi:hypothetical protein